MQTTLKMIALAAVLAATASGGAMAQYVCPPGYTYYGAVCQPMRSPGYSNPVSGAVSGEAAGAASGYRAAGPVGAVVGGALGTAAGTLSGTAGMVTGVAPPPAACPVGYQLYNGYCYARR
jgi:hypothetical protein